MFKYVHIMNNIPACALSFSRSDDKDSKQILRPMRGFEAHNGQGLNWAERCLLLHCNRTRQSVQINVILLYPFSQGLSSAFVGVEFLSSKNAERSQVICNL